MKKKESEIFEEAQNYLWDVSLGARKKIFSSIGSDLMGVARGKMKIPEKRNVFEKPTKNP